LMACVVAASSQLVWIMACTITLPVPDCFLPDVDYPFPLRLVGPVRRPRACPLLLPPDILKHYVIAAPTLHCVIFVPPKYCAHSYLTAPVQVDGSSVGCCLPRWIIVLACIVHAWHGTAAVDYSLCSYCSWPWILCSQLLHCCAQLTPVVPIGPIIPRLVLFTYIVPYCC